MSSFLLHNARIWGQPEAQDCLIKGNRITGFGENAGDKVEAIDCKQALLLPALVDHLSFFNRDIESLTATAAASGFHSFSTLLEDNRHNKESAPELIPPITTFDANGKEILANMGLAYEQGHRVFSNGAIAITNNQLMKQAMSYAADLGATLDHLPQDPTLAASGVMHEGKVSTELGLAGIPPEAEILMLARDLELVRMTGCAYRAQQLSTARGVEMLRQAKVEGLPVTAGVSINHLLLNEAAIGDFRTFCRLTPPLRTEADRQALLAGVRDGTIDFILSAHNPQSQEGKRLPFELAQNGSLGLETFLSAIFLLHEQENFPLELLLAKITNASLDAGAEANLVCFDPKASWELDVATQPLPSKTQNSALDGFQFTGKIKFTLIRGEMHNARSN